MLGFRIIGESFLFAFQSLKANLLRTLLSLLGVTIGIFVIISVLCLVDSMEKNVKDSFKIVGEKIIYIQKWPMTFEKDYPWWRYYKRPSPSFQEYKLLKKRLKEASAVSISGTKANNTIIFGNNSIENITLQGFTHDYEQTTFFNYEFGRYFTEQEMESAKKHIILGYNLYKELFGEENPLDKQIKINGISHKVIGVFKKQGNSLLGMSTDDTGFIPFNVLLTMVSSKSRGFSPFIAVKCKEESDIQELESEAIGLMRTLRRLKPNQEDNFSINKIEMLVKVLDKVFDVMGVVGWFIGGFAMLVGGFGIANIMFVSVKERTNLIGIKKALGAKNLIILSEFLFESIVLSLMGGISGICLVYFTALGLDHWFGDVFRVYLSISNIFLGISISVFLGMLAGLFPAMSAASLNPVDAIRFK